MAASFEGVVESAKVRQSFDFSFYLDPTTTTKKR
jgi:hypothetical protein